MHLAQINIARLTHPAGDPAVAEFIDNLARVNGLGDRSPGFVWRLQGEEELLPENKLSDDAQLIFTLSVWENAAALENFVFKTLHAQFYKKRRSWFEAKAGPNMVLWPVEPGHHPNVPEALARMKDLETNGPSERAFGWAEVMDIERMRALRCA